PKQADAALLLLLLCIGYNCLEALIIFLNVIAVVHQVHIMEAVVGKAHLGHELKGSVHLILCPLEGIGCLVPGEEVGAGTKGISSCAGEGMPVGTGKLKMLLHGLSRHYL